LIRQDEDDEDEKLPYERDIEEVRIKLKEEQPGLKELKF